MQDEHLRKRKHWLTNHLEEQPRTPTIKLEPKILKFHVHSRRGQVT